MRPEDCFYNLAGAVIRQAYEDVEMEKYYNRAYDRAYKQENNFRKTTMQENKKASRTAREFFETDMLERFISSFHLDLNTEYLRRKYEDIKRGEKMFKGMDEEDGRLTRYRNNRKGGRSERVRFQRSKSGGVSEDGS